MTTTHSTYILIQEAFGTVGQQFNGEQAVRDYFIGLNRRDIADKLHVGNENDIYLTAYDGEPLRVAVYTEITSDDETRLDALTEAVDRTSA